MTKWWDKPWNPVIGCTKCSPACENCYAERLHNQRHKAVLAGTLKNQPGYAEPFDRVRFFPERLDQPLHWRKPQRIFVGNMGDLFHADVQGACLNSIFAVMALCPQHTFMLLTKRWERMQKAAFGLEFMGYKLPNVLYGATVWDQSSMDAAAKHLLKMPVGARLFLSIEPMLGPVVIPAELLARLSWVICGGETGPGARPMHPDWPRSLRDQCQAAEVPFFFKQWGEWEVASHDNGHTNSFMGVNGAMWVHNDGLVNGPRWRREDGRTDTEPMAMSRVGKAKAGRVLDGREWSEVPHAS